MENNIPKLGTKEFNDLASEVFGGKPKQDLEEGLFELEQELDISSHLRWHNSKPKQETLEEAFECFKKEYPILKNYNLHHLLQVARFGAKWQQEQDKKMYSEEEVEIIITKLMNDVHCGDLCYGDNVIDFKLSPRQWFEKFKKK